MNKNKGVLCFDISIMPAGIDVATFLQLIKFENAIFYDSRLNPSAIPPYAIKGELGDATLLDISDKKVRAKFELLIKIEELDGKESK